MPRSSPLTALRDACCIAAVAALVSAVAADGGAQSATATELKAAFLVNFAKFTEWPPDALAPAAPLSVCVADAPPLADALETMVRPLTIGGHRVAIERPELQGALQRCHLLFAPDLAGDRARNVLGALNGAATLSVSDTAAFTRAGGVAHLYLEDDRMRFAFNLTAARRARLQVSSRLLVLARIVTGDGR